MKTTIQIHAEHFVARLRRKQKFEQVEFKEWTSELTGIKWASAEVVKTGCRENPRVSYSFWMGENDSLESFREEVRKLLQR